MCGVQREGFDHHPFHRCPSSSSSSFHHLLPPKPPPSFSAIRRIDGFPHARTFVWPGIGLDRRVVHAPWLAEKLRLMSRVFLFAAAACRTVTVAALRSTREWPFVSHATVIRSVLLLVLVQSLDCSDGRTTRFLNFKNSQVESVAWVRSDCGDPGLEKKRKDERKSESFNQNTRR